MLGNDLQGLNLIVGADYLSPNSRELKATTVLEFVIEEASSKIRTGPPIDDDKDYAFPVWAGVLPLSIQSQTPIPDVQLPADMAIAEYVLRHKARLAQNSRSTPSGASSCPPTPRTEARRDIDDSN
jgi:hypothetical protein